VSEFLKDCEAECEECGLSEAQKCAKLFKYCTKGIKDVVEKLVDGEFGKDWSLLKKELKRLYWQKDHLRNSLEELEQLIEEAKLAKVSIEIYVFKYGKISESLIKKHAMSSFERNTRLLRGLSAEVRSKVLDHRSEKGWRMFVNNVDMEEPTFDDATKVVLKKVKAIERREMFNKSESSFMASGYGGATSDMMTSVASVTESTMATAMTSPSSMASDLKDLTEQIARLTLLVGGQPHQQSNPLLPANTSGVTSLRSPWNPRCIYCDSLEHCRNQCPEFQDAVSKGVVGLNKQGRVKLMATGEEVSTMLGKGGMKVIV